MAAPTVAPQIFQQGHRFTLTESLVWSDTTNLSAANLVDVSADFAAPREGVTPSRVTIETLQIYSTAGISCELLFDATSDQSIFRLPLGATNGEKIDFRENGSRGLVPTAAGATGDILITTTSAAAADEISIVMTGRVN